MTAEVELPHLYSGKVRDIYDAGDGRLLLVTSDRISAFDVVMNEPIPDKGRVLTAMSAFWFDELADVVAQPPDLHRPRRPAGRGRRSRAGRAGDAVPQGRDAADRVHRPGLPHRLGLEGVPRRRAPCTARRCPRACSSRRRCPSRSSPRRPRPAEGHDENISFDQAVDLVGAELAARARDVSLELYRRGARRGPLERGIIIADTKFELGLVDGELVVADEVLTPDSSRFWPADQWRAGHDAAVVRQAAGARLPRRAGLEQAAAAARRCRPRSCSRTRDRYVEAYERITGLDFADWPGAPEPADPTSALDGAGRRRGVRRWAPWCSPCTSTCSCGPASPIRRARPSSARCPPSGSRRSAGCGWARASASRSRPPTRPPPGRGSRTCATGS